MAFDLLNMFRVEDDTVEVCAVDFRQLPPTPRPGFVYDDGGRKAAGYVGTTGDCVCRAIAIATGLPYQQVYDDLNALGAAERKSKRRRGKSSARTGVYKATSRKYLTRLGWTWVPTMTIGSDCKVHLDAKELPSGFLIVQVSKHLTAMIDGVIHDTYDPRRDGETIYGHPPVMDPDGQLRNPVISTGGGRCVYGYWKETR